MSNGRAALWVTLALLGIVFAAALTWSVMRLAGEHIGLASAPISVVHGLVPGPGAGGAAAPEHDVTRTVIRTVTVGTAVTAPGSTSNGATQQTAPAVTTGVTATSPLSAATRQATATSPITLSPPTRTGSGGTDDGRELTRAGSSRRED